LIPVARSIAARRAAALLSLVGLLAGCDRRAGSAPPAGAPRPPRGILLVTIESLRADHVGCLGYGRATTPRLDELARVSTLYPNAFSVTSWTLASHASLFTGLYPSAHRVVDPRDRLAEAAVTFAELLQGKGWQTTGLASGPYLAKHFRLDQGFESWDDSLGPDFSDIDRAPTNPAIEAAVARFLAAPRDAAQPFLLFVYCWDPHYSYLPPPPWDAKFVPPGAVKIDVSRYDGNERIRATMPKPELDYVVSQYDGEIGATDAMLGRVFDALRAKGWWDDLAVIVTADHGEEFFEHGQKGHKRNLYRESLHVPLWVKAPGQRDARRDERIVDGVDLFPTILELAGVEHDGPVHGRSLLQPDDPARATFHELVTSWYFGRRGEREKRSDRWTSVRQGDRQLFTIDFFDQRHEQRLYDLATDPGQQHRLDPSSDRALEQRLAEFLRSAERIGKTLEEREPAPLSPEDEARLRAAGYLDDDK
jgi:arylsulfatase A-like enzyme